MKGFIIFLIVLAIIFFAKSKKTGSSRKRSPLQQTRRFSERTNATANGKMGENLVAVELDKLKGQNGYVINNYLMETGEEQSSQIDHILINSYGVWVIETKTYSGRIYGSEGQLEWTQVLDYGRKKHQFYNPVKQNATHIYHLRKILGSDVPVYSLVVFVSGDIAKVTSSGVCNLSRMQWYIETHGVANVSAEQMKRWYQILMEKKQTVTTTEQEHIQNVRTQQENLERGICPRCKGQLVLRDGKNGQFYGCSNYPMCKFTKRGNGEIRR